MPGINVSRLATPSVKAPATSNVSDVTQAIDKLALSLPKYPDAQKQLQAGQLSTKWRGDEIEATKDCDHDLLLQGECS